MSVQSDIKWIGQDPRRDGNKPVCGRRNSVGHRQLGQGTAKSLGSQQEAQIGEGLGKFRAKVFRINAHLKKRPRYILVSLKKTVSYISRGKHSSVLGEIRSHRINKALFLECLFYSTIQESFSCKWSSPSKLTPPFYGGGSLAWKTYEASGMVVYSAAITFPELRLSIFLLCLALFCVQAFSSYI